ncbi:uncharacterized protein LOC124812066 [Hydra vulgaris]|uniref:uncharacterized protein LOC124812066 n=1 Tax=Hydra vulgaris TaxID=6087 RepID=UPI001F5ED72A|nr:uncharacterized protein LOC124812066 [Hydra vulgaris]
MCIFKKENAFVFGATEVILGAIIGIIAFLSQEKSEENATPYFFIIPGIPGVIFGLLIFTRFEKYRNSNDRVCPHRLNSYFCCTPRFFMIAFVILNMFFSYLVHFGCAAYLQIKFKEIRIA